MTGRSAFALTAANLAAGVLNYLFQVHAAAALDAAAFGLFSAWLARVSLASSVASVVQFMSLDHRLPAFEKRVVPVGAVAAGILALHLVAGERLSMVALGAFAVLGAVLLYAVVGQLQSRLRLTDVAAATLLAAATRFSLPLGTSFYVAHAGASFGGVALAAVLVLARPRAPAAKATEPSAPEQRLRLARPVLLAFGLVLFPQLDVLVLSWMQDAPTLGAFSRVALAARVVFFGGAAIFQVLLPHQIHAAETGEPLPPFVVLAQRWFSPVLLVAALAVAALADVAILHPTSTERIWLFASCASAALLVAILAHVQRFAAHGRLAAALACSVGGLGASALGALGVVLSTESSVTAYVAIALCGNALVLAFATAAQSRFTRRAG